MKLWPAKIVKATKAAVAPLLAAGRSRKTPRRPGERWIENGREMQYWPERDEPDRIDYFAPGGVRRSLERMRGRWSGR